MPGVHVDVFLPWLEKKSTLSISQSNWASDLPCLQRFAIQPYEIRQDTGLDVCFNHPQITDLECNFYVDGNLARGGFIARLDTLLMNLQADISRTRPRFKSLVLPDISNGHPKNFLIPLLQSHLPNVERMKFPVVRLPSDQQDVQALQDAIAAVLDLRVDRNVVVPEGKSKVAIVNHAVGGFFAQIGTLLHLEELGLGCGINTRREADGDLILEDGWLAKLTGLKQLWHLTMHSDYWSAMGQADVESMDLNWPRLERISFGWQAEEIRNENHWI